MPEAPDTIEESQLAPEPGQYVPHTGRTPGEQPSYDTGPRRSSRTRQAPVWHNDYDVTNTVNK